MFHSVDLGGCPALQGKDCLFKACLARLSHCWRNGPYDGLPSAEVVLRALWLAACGQSCSYQQAAQEPLPPLTELQRAGLDALVSRFEQGEPLAHLTGRWRFMDLDFFTGPQALIPRPETEFLCSRALALLSRLAMERRQITVLEPCTGSGNLAIALAHHQPACHIWAVDLSLDALELARRNATHFHLSERIRFQAGDLFEPLKQTLPVTRADLVVCNPPYISSARLDSLPRELLRLGPRLAFDGGPFGLNIIGRLIREAPPLLKPASFLCFEVGCGHGAFLADLMRQSRSFARVALELDPQTQTPVIIAQTESAA